MSSCRTRSNTKHDHNICVNLRRAAVWCSLISGDRIYGVCQVRREKAAAAAEDLASKEQTPLTVDEVSIEKSTDRSILYFMV